MVTKSTSDIIMEAILGDIKEEVKKKVEVEIGKAKSDIEDDIKAIKTKCDEATKLLDSVVEDKPLIVTIGSVKKPKKELVHSAFPKVLKILQSQKRKEKNIMLVGEAGSGKTHLVATIAKALGREFYPMSVGLQTTKSDLLGFVNAQGGYVTTPVREAYEKGGVLLLDEFDSAHAGVVTILNSLLANGHCSFADKIVTKHPDFICICACNTYGRGANVEYVGRNRLDSATLDRFIVVDVGYDTKLEEKLTGNKEWVDVIKKIRSNANKQGIKIVISPRASMDGADLLEQGFSVEEVVEMVVLKGRDSDTKVKLLKGVKLGGASKSSARKKSNKKVEPDLEVVLDLDNNMLEILKCKEIRLEGTNNKLYREAWNNWDSSFNILITDNNTPELRENVLFWKKGISNSINVQSGHIKHLANSVSKHINTIREGEKKEIPVLKFTIIKDGIEEVVTNAEEE